MKNSNLENFYEAWSSKTSTEIDYDIVASLRKADEITSYIPTTLSRDIRSVLDFGCGYGALLRRFQERWSLQEAVGVDFSSTAIEIARRQFQQDGIQYHKLPSLDTAQNMEFLRSIIPAKVDCILLIDLLEHVADCKALVANLAQFTEYFLIKLPVESALLDNYILPKEYPGSNHSNGHLREFDAHNVYSFIRQLGFTPHFEMLYIYHLDDMFPPPQSTLTPQQKLVRVLLKSLKLIASKILPKKIFLRTVGGGGYFCLATYDHAHVLNP